MLKFILLIILSQIIISRKLLPRYMRLRTDHSIIILIISFLRGRCFHMFTISNKHLPLPIQEYLISLK